MVSKNIPWVIASFPRNKQGIWPGTLVKGFMKKDQADKFLQYMKSIGSHDDAHGPNLVVMEWGKDETWLPVIDQNGKAWAMPPGEAKVLQDTINRKR